MPTVYDWSPVTGAINNQIDQWGQRNQYNNLLNSVSGNPNTGFPAQDQRMMAGAPSPMGGVNPQAMQMLRGMSPQAGMSMLPLLLRLGAKDNQAEYDTGEHIGVNPSTGKPEKYVLNKVTGQPQWTGISPVAAEAKPEATPDVIQVAKQLFPNDPAKQNQYIMRNSPANLRDMSNSGGGQQESWGQPVTEAGQDGKPIVVRYSNTGGRQIVPGAVPKPTNRSLSPKLVDSISAAGTALDTMTRLNTSYKDDYSGNLITGGLENLYLRNKPGGDPSGQAQWWQDYQAYVNQVRNDLFGAALTPGEKAEFEKAILTERMSPEESRKNLKRQLQLSAKAAQRKSSPYVTGGYDKETIEEALGYSMEDIAKMNAPQGAQANATPAGGGWSIKPKGQ